MARILITGSSDGLGAYAANKLIKSGHSVVFLGWAEQDGKRVGLRYRSSQGSTKGVGDVTEYFTDAKDPDGKPGRVLRDRTYFGRLKLD